MNPHAHRRPNAFTLIELLTVIAIIGILGAILIPVATGALSRAKLAKCVGNLSQIGSAVLLYAAEHNNCYPGHGASGNNETGAGQRWYQKTAPYLDEGLVVSHVRVSGQTDENFLVAVCDEAWRAEVLHCPCVDREMYTGNSPKNTGLGIYRSNLNLTTRSLNGISMDAVSFPSQTVLLADCYIGVDLADASGVASGPNMALNAPPYPQNASGPCANHRSDGDCGADPLGAGACPMLFADGHAEIVELSDLRPWADCIDTSGRRPKNITMIP